MHLALLVSDGPGVRNLILGDFLDLTSTAGAVSVLHEIPESLLAVHRAKWNGAVRWVPLLPYHEAPVSAALRYTLAYAHMFWADTQAMRHNRRAAIGGSWRRRVLHKSARLAGRVAASCGAIPLLDRFGQRSVAASPDVAHYRALFAETRPSLLLCSHQRPPHVLPAVLAANSLGIPSATMIFSWDNLTSKGRIAAPFRHYMVWSDHMRDDLRRYHPDITPDRIHVVGTPQFDVYADRSVVRGRDEFFRGIGADPSRPLICYSGGDTGTAPEDHEHLRILMELIQAGRIQGRPQVLVRPAPVDDGRRYDDVRARFPEIIYARPAWVDVEPGNWARVMPLREDVMFLANLTQHADLNINLASTMTLDFAIHDKPVVNIAFDVADPPLFGASLWDFYYRFEHYRPVVELGAARFARSADQLADHVNAYLQDPSLDRDARRRLVEMQLSVPPGQSLRRLVDALSRIAA